MHKKRQQLFPVMTPICPTNYLKNLIMYHVIWQRQKQQQKWRYYITQILLFLLIIFWEFCCYINNIIACTLSYITVACTLTSHHVFLCIIYWNSIQKCIWMKTTMSKTRKICYLWEGNVISYPWYESRLCGWGSSREEDGRCN